MRQLIYPQTGQNNTISCQCERDLEAVLDQLEINRDRTAIALKRLQNQSCEYNPNKKESFLIRIWEKFFVFG